MLAIVFLLGIATAAANQDSTRTARQQGDSVQNKKSGFFALPVVFYKPETKIAVGIVGICYFRDGASREDTRASSIQAGFIYTQRKQIITKIEPQVFLSDEKYFLSGDLSFFKYPEKFYGIGNDTPSSAEEEYTPQILRFRASAEYQVLHHLYLGAHFVLIDSKIIQYDTGGQLINGSIPGSSGATLSGLGVLIKWDDRNNIFAPSMGRSYELSILSFQKPFGSEFAYTLYTVELKQYFSFIEHQDLACQIYGGFTAGTAPFQYLQRLGGEKMMRGYLEGRFLDNDYVLAQIEYRFPIWWRFGMVVFGGVGQVSPSPSHLSVRGFRSSAGFGLRYAISREEKLNIRIDFGFGENGNSGFYLTATEAF